MMPLDWLFGLIGGLMIGSAAALLLLGDGRIMGASGIIAGLLDGVGDATWRSRATFVAALIVVPALAAFASGGADTHATSNLWLLLTGGLLVGYGTRLGNGCTSGHGVCGISRASRRGFFATCTFVAVAVLTYALLFQVAGVSV